MIFCSVTAWGQELYKNLISFGINFADEFPYTEIYKRLGINFEYERLLNPNFSIGLDIGLDLSWPYAEIQGRWYPWAGKFFTGFGLGTIYVFGYYKGHPNILFPVISPGIGWKIDIGKANKWVIIPSIVDRMDFRPLNTNILELNFKIGRKF